MAFSGYQDQRRPLLLADDEEANFVCYDEDDLQAAAKLRRKRQKIRVCLWLSCGVFLILVIAVGLFFGTYSRRNSKGGGNSSSLGKYKHAAVASDVTQCSQIGSDIMEKSGGNAVDAAIASLLCMGLADPQSMGIGGGFFMTIYNRSTGESWSIDAREVAPLRATEDMFYPSNTSSTTGGLAVAVPGEIRGYQKALERFGTLSWEQVFQPAVTMATEGFKVPKSLESAINDLVAEYGENITHFPEFMATYKNPETGIYYKEGEVIKLTKLSRTLDTIAREGPDAFYSGNLSSDILEELQNAGAVITAEDLQQYEIRLEGALNVRLSNNYTIYAPASPSSGAILMFILNILDGYKITPEDVKTKDRQILIYHRIVEAFKFAYAKRTELADVKFWPNVTQLIANLTDRAYADSIRSLIWDNQTHPYQYYGPTYYDKNKTSTAHLSVVDKDGNAVSVTSTVNTRFGSKVFGSKTGIVYNNEMDDFATSNQPNDFGLYPSPANKIKPGKRPLSSMSPSIFVDDNRDVRLVVGAAGGSRITTATAYVAARVLWFGENIEQAISALRLHHQLLPQEISYERGFDQEVIDGLKVKGHNVTMVEATKSIVQGITRNGEYLYANSDFRKGGLTAGF